MTDRPRVRCRLAGQLTVSLPPAQAFHLFTARGEQVWAQDWKPIFPVPADDAAVGTVFQTVADDHPTTWIVVASEPGRLIRYAQVAHGLKAAIITVSLEEDADGGSEVTVVYDLTSLSAEGDHQLRDFATGYAPFLESWREAIAHHLTTATSGPGSRDQPALRR